MKYVDNFMKSKKTKTIITLDIINRITILLHIATIWISLNYTYSPPKEVLQEILSVSSENIIGLYGITLTGYVFFLGRIDNLLVNNNDLDRIIYSIKKNFSKMILGITINVIVALLGIGISTYFVNEKIFLPEWCYYLLANETLLFTGMAVLLILYFVIRVIDAEIIEKEALKIKNEISAEEGNVLLFDEYLLLYNEIKTVSMKILPEYIKTSLYSTNDIDYNLLLQYMKSASKLHEEICDNLDKINLYYSCILHSKNFEVSTSMCELARETKKLLTQKGVRYASN